jgi:hypothetical protein
LTTLFSIKTIEFVSGPAGHNKFCCDGLFGNITHKLNSGIRTTWGVYNLINSIIPKKSKHYKCFVVRKGFVDNSQFLLTHFNNGIAKGIQKWHNIKIELDEKIYLESIEINKLKGLPQSPLVIENYPTLISNNIFLSNDTFLNLHESIRNLFTTNQVPAISQTNLNIASEFPNIIIYKF